MSQKSDRNFGSHLFRKQHRSHTLPFTNQDLLIIYFPKEFYDPGDNKLLKCLSVGIDDFSNIPIIINISGLRFNTFSVAKPCLKALAEVAEALQSSHNTVQ